METITAPTQEGTFVSDRHIDVPVAHSASACQTVTEVLNRVGDKWSMQVVMNLGEGSLRFNQLRRAIDGISQRMLTRTLRGLERDGAGQPQGHAQRAAAGRLYVDRSRPLAAAAGSMRWGNGRSATARRSRRRARGSMRRPSRTSVFSWA